MSLPKITIIVPTRERCDVLGAALRSVCAQDYDGLDILVSDNFSSDATADVVHAVGDPRIRYVNTGERLSMSHNWEFALSHVPVDDRYVMVIGDDDGIVPRALDRIGDLIRETNAKALNSTYVTYIWPNEDNACAGRLLVPMRRGSEIRDSKEWLRKVLDGRAWYSDLPMLYASGAIHISLLDEIRRQSGTFFRSCIPDVYSSVAIASRTDQYVFSYEPFAIAGHSSHSNGAAWGVSGKAEQSRKSLRAKELFASEANIPWHADIPTLPDGKIPFNVDLIVYESYLQAARIHSDPFKLDRMDMLALFLASDIPDRTRMQAWIPLFAERHGLDVGAARRRASTVRKRLEISRFVDNITAFREMYRLEPSFGVRIRDVYDASVVAATILATRPNLLRSYLRTIAKRLGRARAPAGRPSQAA